MQPVHRQVTELENPHRQNFRVHDRAAAKAAGFGWISPTCDDGDSHARHVLVKIQR